MRRSARILGVPIDDDAAAEIGAPLARHAAHRQPPAAPRARLRAGARRRAHLRPTWRATALTLLEVDEHGFDEVDRKLLRTIIDKFSGGPVGVNSLAAAIHEEKDAIEDIYEPFLIQAGFLDRTPRGRVATAARLRVFRAHPPEEGSASVVTAAAAHRVPCAHREPRDLRAAASCSPTPISRRWSRPATSGFCSAPASASATSSSRASARRTWPTKAALQAIERAGLTPDDIDFIVVGTTTPDMMFPSTACLVQDNIGATNAWGYDLFAACSGFTYALTTAAQHGVHRRAASTRW